MVGSTSRQELLYRIRNVPWLASHALRLATEFWDCLSPSAFARLFRQVRPLTMCSDARLRGLYRAVHHVVAQDIPGDIVECGVARGGSAALMGLTLRKLGSNRRLWLFDTFEGLPAPSDADPDFHIANRYTGTCIGRLEEVRANFSRLGIVDGTNFVKGLFEDTLPTAPIERIAVLHIDGDWYRSVRACLQCLYEKVSPGGVIQFDDYGYWKGARKAVDEFLAERNILGPLSRLDFSGRQFAKPSLDPYTRHPDATGIKPGHFL